MMLRKACAVGFFCLIPFASAGAQAIQRRIRLFGNRIQIQRFVLIVIGNSQARPKDQLPRREVVLFADAPEQIGAHLVVLCDRVAIEALGAGINVETADIEAARAGDRVDGGVQILFVDPKL